MSAQSRTRSTSSSTTTTSAPNDHVLPLSLFAAALESVASVIAVSGSVLYVVKTNETEYGWQRQVVEVAGGRIVGTTKPEWIYAHIRELIRKCNEEGWTIRKLDL